MAITEYVPQNWENGPEGDTPINEERLEHIESGLHLLSQQAIAESHRITVSADPPSAPNVGDIWIPIPA